MKTKLSLLTFAVLLSTFGLTGQVFGQQTQTLFSGNTIRAGGFGGPVLRIGSISGETAFLMGGRGGAFFVNENKNSFSIGGGGYGLVNPLFILDEHGTEYKVDMGLGGFELEYNHKSYRLVHFSISTLFGAGGLNEQNQDTNTRFDSSFFIIEPSLHAVVNVTHYLRFSAGMSYNTVYGSGSDLLSNSDLSGFQAVIGFRFGSF